MTSRPYAAADPVPAPEPEGEAGPETSPPGEAEPSPAPEPQPPLRRVRSAGITILATLAVLYTLYFARVFLVPLVFALLLMFLLSPAIRYLARQGIRPPVGSAFVIGSVILILGVAAYGLSAPAQQWAANAPENLRKVEERLRELAHPVARISATAEQVERVTDVVNGPDDEVGVVVREGPTLAARIFGTTERFVVGLLEVIVLTYFLLAGGDLFLQKLVKVLPRIGDRKRAVEVARATEATVSAYLSTQLLLAVTEAAVVAALLWWLGLPNALLWGVVIACLEFIPYLGALALVVLLGIAGLTAFESLGRALMPPAIYLAVNLIQANLVAPALLGARLTLNPVAIVVGLAFFFWIWGIPGAFLAVPLVATLKILADHVPALTALGEFLGQRDARERRAIVRG